MTAAVCLKCGSFKVGAWTLCPACGFEPATDDDRAKSVALSDHKLTKAQLAAAGERVKAGEPIGFDQALIAELSNELRKNPELAKMPVGCLIAVWAPFVIMLLLAAVLVSLIVFGLLAGR